mmetsp:Transcript_41322/g.95694  ORF Transcript_41322/g.95694 Transcript_41322/m.95694 type:complete len:272 (-) Transcript_41322:94-909(-)
MERNVSSVEQFADLHEYGLSLGIDLDVEGEGDLLAAVQEAFNAPLPSSWREYMHDSGRVYYVKEGSSQSTWEHPMDEVYRELFSLIKDVRSRKPEASDSQRTDVVREHLKRVHQRAKNELAGWSGPYSSEYGDYYFNEDLGVSTWECPVAEWETELATRHAVLSRYLLRGTAIGTSSGSASCLAAEDGERPEILQALRLQLGNLQRDGQEDAPLPSTSRSFHTARSTAGSSRSGRSGRSGGKDKEQKERRDRKERSAAQPSQQQQEFTSVD